VAALLCDLDDTLIDRQAAFERFAGALLARHGLPSTALATLRRLDAETQRHVPRFAAAVIAAFGLSLTREAFAEAFLTAMADHASPFPQALPLLRRLRGRLRVAVVTNGGSRTQRRKLEVTGIDALVDAIFVSTEVGADKPAPAIFAQALRWSGVPARDVLFVGDDPLRDVAGASRAGMRTAWMAHGREFPAGLPRPHHVLAHLGELEALLP
jgi:putative hydrolase of the HAD superfamily